MSNPSVFIGSSSEGIEVARAISLNLQNDALIIPWYAGVFEVGEGTLESLVTAADEFDFAILVFTADDSVISRGETYSSARDNVLFELGLFMGKLGRYRTFFVYSPDADLKIPSDLAGVTPAVYRLYPNGNLQAALDPPCTLIRNAIRKYGSLEKRLESSESSLGIKQVHEDQTGTNLISFIRGTEDGSEIKLLGITIRGLNDHHVRNAIIQKLRAGCKAKILLLDRDSKFVSRRATEEKRQYDEWRRELIHYDDLHQEFINNEVPQELRENIILDHYDALPICSIIMNNKIMIVGYYPNGQGGVFSPHLELEVKEMGLCVPFGRYFDSLWKRG
jgi:hypothetical protein